MYEYLRTVKSQARTAYQNAISSGKKKNTSISKAFDKCQVSVVSSYPTWYLQTVEILSE